MKMKKKKKKKKRMMSEGEPTTRTDVRGQRD